LDEDKGRACGAAKIASRSGALTIHLEPATKVIGKMRELFPESLVVGWKYELVGTKMEAMAKAARQIDENGTDACVLNGRALGQGFAFCTKLEPMRELKDKAALVRFLRSWLNEMLRDRRVAAGNARWRKV
jgi:hypothetical protein